MGVFFPPYYGKSAFYEKKKEKALKDIEKFENKIAELRKVVAECDAEIAKQTAENK